MANTLSKHQVHLTIPMHQDMELIAAKTVSVFAELNNFDEGQVEEIQLAVIESCINAFEHSQSEDKQVFIEFIMRTDALEFKITDRGVGFNPDKPPKRLASGPVLHSDMRKRGWGLEIVRTLMDEVDIESGADGTTISGVKKKTD